MPTDTQPRSIPFGTLLLCAVVGGFYTAMLAHIRFSAGGGDAVIGEAIAMLMLTVALFIALALLVISVGVMGHMGKGPVIAAFILIPTAGVATVTAIDACSRHIHSAVVFPVLLPLLIALYALTVRFPGLRGHIPPERISAAAWGLVFVLSVLAMMQAAVF
jgi:hypothetical protein